VLEQPEEPRAVAVQRVVRAPPAGTALIPSRWEGGGAATACLGRYGVVTRDRRSGARERARSPWIAASPALARGLLYPEATTPPTGDGQVLQKDSRS
jgi:hypothetical protein